MNKMWIMIAGLVGLVFFVCASGMRSAQAAKMLTAAGFSDVTNAGGLGNLK